MSWKRPFVRILVGATTQPRRSRRITWQLLAVIALAFIAVWPAEAQERPSTAAVACGSCADLSGSRSGREQGGFIPPTMAEIKLDRFFYDSGSRVSATLWVSDIGLLRRDAMKVVFAGSETRDAEAISLRPSENPRVFTAEELPVEVASGEATVKPGDFHR